MSTSRTIEKRIVHALKARIENNTIGNNAVAVMNGELYAIEHHDPIDVVRNAWDEDDLDEAEFLGALDQFVRPELMALHDTVGLQALSEGILFGGMVRAIAWAHQMSGTEVPELEDVIGPAGLWDDEEDDSYQAHHLLADAVEDVAAAIFQEPSGDDAATALCTSGDDGTVTVRWVTSADISPPKTLERVVHEALTPVLPTHVCRASRIAAAAVRQRLVNRTALIGLLPETVAIAQRCLARRETLGYYFGATEDITGRPVDMFMYAQYDRAAPCVDLVFRQQFDEFLLESPSGTWSYFPGGQVQARVRFLAGSHFELMPPEVRLPAKSPRFAHPFTGYLGDDPFAHVVMINAHQCPPDSPTPIAPAAESRLKIMRQHPSAQLRDMCLPGQYGILTRLAEHARATQSVCSAITRILVLTRQGLMRAHQWEELAPRIGWEDLPNMLSADVDPTQLGVSTYSFQPGPRTVPAAPSLADLW